MSQRVLIVHVPYENRGGEDVHVEILAEAYRELGLTPIFFPENRSSEKQPLSGVVRSLFPGVEPDALAEVWSRFKPAWLHVHNAFPTLGPAFFRWVIHNQIPLVMTIHNHRFFCTNGLALRNGRECKDCFHSKVAWRPLLYNCNSQWHKSAYHAIALSEMNLGDLYRRAVRHFIAPSPYIRDELIQWGVPEDRVTHVLNPVDIGPDPVMPDRFRYDVLFAGRLSHEKGLRELIAAFERLPDLKLGIVGDGPERSWLETRIKDQPGIDLLGVLPRSKVIELIRESRIGVLPSICNEILPTFVLECFAQGRRCVLSSQKSLSWLAQGEFPGTIADIRNSGAFADAIRGCVAERLPETASIEALRRRFQVDRFAQDLNRIFSATF